ncbi:hypothetical protein BOTCAL_0179g00090 [Botryotinia calthae]|uniref:Uncharacterized protein n=1 Tax=Botryotinia calthae TaxID=38488 RepID=A0A4Y8D319_9HELO|nr:hypothetical protein BOTCAL_0179g00090 [Botryotinia calthae]
MHIDATNGGALPSSSRSWVDGSMLDPDVDRILQMTRMLGDPTNGSPERMSRVTPVRNQWWGSLMIGGREIDVIVRKNGYGI